MPPFAGGNLTNAQNNFNHWHQKVRNIIERCIGTLKMRFRCLLKERELRYHPTRASNITNACATIHNFLIVNNYNIEEGVDRRNDFNGEEIDEEIDDNGDDINTNVVGMEVRNEICDYFQLLNV